MGHCTRSGGFSVGRGKHDPHRSDAHSGECLSPCSVCTGPWAVPELVVMGILRTTEKQWLKDHNCAWGQKMYSGNLPLKSVAV